jgi:hypothetical protein
MAIVAKNTGGGGKGRDLGPLAPRGLHQAVCVDVLDLGKITSTYNGQAKERHVVQMIWQLRDDETRQRFLAGKWFTLSLNERASLRKDLESWFAKAITREQELNGIDLEKLIGVACTLNIMHATKGDRTYANVTAVLPRDKKQPKLVAEGYTRADTADDDATDDTDDPFAEDTGIPPAHVVTPAPVVDVTDDDIPF